MLSHARQFFSRLLPRFVARTLARMREDILAVFLRDPAARTLPEVLLCYPGLHALWSHRVAHMLWNRGATTGARVFSQWSRFFTGVEIHPGAVIGRRVFIDHGMGVVIGETTIIGDDVTLFQGVTLGGTGKEKGKRHPTLEDRVIIGTGAKVLGSNTIGHDSVVGGGSVVLVEVPPFSTVVGVPGRVITQDGQRVAPRAATDEAGEPDETLNQTVRVMQAQLDHLRQEVTDVARVRAELLAQNEDWPYADTPDAMEITASSPLHHDGDGI